MTAPDPENPDMCVCVCWDATSSPGNDCVHGVHYSPVSYCDRGDDAEVRDAGMMCEGL